MLNTPPPILTRVFQELGSGLVKYHMASQVVVWPFPFPYTQVNWLLLCVYMLVTPIVNCAWGLEIWQASVLTFTSVVCLLALDLISSELENPFGDDPNDLPCFEMQHDMNHELLLLLHPCVSAVPRLLPTAEPDYEALNKQVSVNRVSLQEYQMNRKVHVGKSVSTVSAKTSHGLRAPSGFTRKLQRQIAYATQDYTAPMRFATSLRKSLIPDNEVGQDSAMPAFGIIGHRDLDTTPERLRRGGSGSDCQGSESQITLERASVASSGDLLDWQKPIGSSWRNRHGSMSSVQSIYQLRALAPSNTDGNFSFQSEGPSVLGKEHQETAAIGADVGNTPGALGLLGSYLQKQTGLLERQLTLLEQFVRQAGCGTDVPVHGPRLDAPSTQRPPDRRNQTSHAVRPPPPASSAWLTEGTPGSTPRRDSTPSTPRLRPVQEVSSETLATPTPSHTFDEIQSLQASKERQPTGHLLTHLQNEAYCSSTRPNGSA